MKQKFNQPAKCWHESHVLGNGRIGATVFGGTKIEEIDLNEDTLWSGYPYDSRKVVEEKYLKKTRKLAKDEKYQDAMEYMEEIMLSSEDTQMYVPFGNLYIEMLGEQNISEYERILDLETAEVVISYKDNDNHIKRRCLVSEPHQVLIYEIKSEKPISVCFTTDGGYLNECSYDSGVVKSKGRCPGRNHFTKSDTSPEVVIPTFSEDPEKMGMYYEGRGIVKSEGGAIISDSEGVRVIDSTLITIYYGIRSSYAGHDKHPVLEGTDVSALLEKDMRVVEQDYDSIRERHLKEYQSYYKRVSFELNDSQDVDSSLEAFLFHYGRYLLIASSRPGTQTANLQGIWNKELVPPWFCDYTININTQMNYWMTGICNMPEMGEPLKEFCLSMLEEGRKTAQHYYGVDGVCAFHNTDIWRKTTPADGRAMWSFWPMGYAWLCKNLYDQYQFTEDEEYLKEIYPILHENVLFAIQTVEETVDGYAMTPATSPENEFWCNEKKTSVAYYSEHVNAIIRNLLRDYIQASNIIGEQNPIFKRAVEVLEGMAPLKSGTLGQVLEWNEELEEVDPKHRHLSHLYELYPGNGINSKTKEYREAAEISLLRRGDGKMGWSLAWKMCLWARLQKGEYIGEIIPSIFTKIDPDDEKLKYKGGLYPNMLCASPYQIDGNLGYTAGMAEMLLQSHENGIIHILPAIPSRWRSGKVQGLCARGAIVVNISWSTTCTKIVFKSNRDKSVRLKVRDEEIGDIQLVAGKEKVISLK